MAARGIFDDSVFHAVVRVAGFERGVMNRRELGVRHEARFVFVRGLRDPHRLHRAAGPVQGGCTPDAPIAISGAPLRAPPTPPSARRSPQLLGVTGGPAPESASPMLSPL